MTPTPCKRCSVEFISPRRGGSARPLCPDCSMSFKWCWACVSVQPIDEFHRDRNTRDGLNARCNPCSSAQAKLARRQRTPEENFDGHLRARYKISHSDYVAMSMAQNGACAICLETGVKLVVDHCHTTGVVRGLLCHACNKGIGHLRDDLEVVRRAVDYLSPRPA